LCSGRFLEVSLAFHLQAHEFGAHGQHVATWPPNASTLPCTWHGTSTVALSVMMSAMTWSSATASPGCTCQAAISTSAMPSPMSGTRMM